MPPSPRGLKVLSGPVEPNEPPQDLTPATKRQDHTTSPSASCAVVLRAAYRSRRAIRPALRIRMPDAAASTATHPAFVTIAIRPLWWGGMTGVVEVICAGAEQKFIFLWGWTAALILNLARRAADFFMRSVIRHRDRSQTWTRRGKSLVRFYGNLVKPQNKKYFALPEF